MINALTVPVSLPPLCREEKSRKYIRQLKRQIAEVKKEREEEALVSEM